MATQNLYFTPVIGQIFNQVIGAVISKIRREIHIQTTTEFYLHLSQLDIEFREDPEIKTKEDIARETLEEASQTIGLLYGLLSSLLRLLALVTIVSALHPIIVILVFINVFIDSLITKKANNDQNALTHDYYKLQRYVNTFETPLIQVYYAKEVSLFGLTNYFVDRYKTAQTDVDRMTYKRESCARRSGIKISVLNTIQEGVFYAYMIYNVLSGNMLVGNMSIFSNAAHQFSNSLSSIFNQYLEMSRKQQDINDTIEYMSMPLIPMTSGNYEPVFDENSIIEFKDVYFKYPGTESYALQNFNICIHANERLCIVGVNGAGKSTFIKLLLRMYRPASGQILLNGRDIYEYDYKKYWRLFSPVFQECEIFGGLSFKDNIILADGWDKEKFARICHENALSDLIEKMPKGIDTSIDTWVDEEGIKPSGGERQHIAIARAMYHGGSIYILDEPTAALDPIAEYEIYTQFNDLITDKCAILITHRLSAVQLADKVAVIDDGEVKEYGTHRDLYLQNGIYTEMFDKQSKFYREDPSSKE